MVRLRDIYAKLLKINSIRDVLKLDYDELLDHNLLQPALVFNCLYNSAAETPAAL